MLSKKRAEAMNKCVDQPNYPAFSSMQNEIEKKFKVSVSVQDHKFGLERRFMDELKKKSDKQIISRQKYDGQHPPMDEFTKPWETCVQVGLNSNKLSTEKKPIQCDGMGFIGSIGLILKNEGNGDVLLSNIRGTSFVEQRPFEFATMVERFLSKISGLPAAFVKDAMRIACSTQPDNITFKDFTIEMKNLNKDGLLHGRFICGKDGLFHLADRIHGYPLKYFAIRMDTDIYVDSAKWSVAYKPADSSLFIDKQDGKMLLEYKY